MFRLSERLSGAPAPQQRYLKRALLFAGGLLLLWLAVQLAPAGTPPAATPVYTDDAGTVAAKAAPVAYRQAPRLVTPGTFFALLLLGGGGAFALYLRRRRGTAGAPAAFIAPVETFALAPNQQLRLVRCGDEVLLLGVTSGQISLLKSYAGDAFEAAGVYEDPAPAPAPQAAPPQDFAHSHFADVLRHYAGRYTGTQPTSRHAS